MKRFKLLLASLWVALPLFLTGVALAAETIDTSSPQASACQASNGHWDGTKCTSVTGAKDIGSVLTSVTKTLIFIVGAISVIMIIIGGLRYVLSGGDSAGVKSAKDTVLYAIVGVIVAFIAYGIVTFVITRIG